MDKLFQGLITMALLFAGGRCVSDIPTGEDLFFEQQTIARAFRALERREALQPPLDRLVPDELSPHPQATPLTLT